MILKAKQDSETALSHLARVSLYPRGTAMSILRLDSRLRFSLAKKPGTSAVVRSARSLLRDGVLPLVFRTTAFPINASHLLDVRGKEEVLFGSYLDRLARVDSTNDAADLLPKFPISFLPHLITLL